MNKVKRTARKRRLRLMVESGIIKQDVTNVPSWIWNRDLAFISEVQVELARKEKEKK